MLRPLVSAHGDSTVASRKLQNLDQNLPIGGYKKLCSTPNQVPHEILNLKKCLQSMNNPDFALAESVTTTNASYFIFIYILILIYCCFGLAVVCDVYFVPALQKLSYTYDLPPDIAGSTLMALGASVPELFASLIGVFVTENDIGTGSIIGSSCFNLIAVPAACAFVASATFTRKLTISPMPVIRNSAFYAITILVLLLIIKDNKVDIPEAIILLLFFVMYMAFMIFCAQTKNNSNNNRQHQSWGSSHTNQQNQQQHHHQNDSLTSNSYISTDSAIHSDDCQDQSEKSHRQNQSQQTALVASLQQAYGQYYFDTNQNDPSGYQTCPSLNETSHISSSTSNLANERTPLVKLANKSLQIPIARQSQQQPKSAYPSLARAHLDQSQVSLDLGLPIKNSTCLVRRCSDDSTGNDNDPFVGCNIKLIESGDHLGATGCQKGAVDEHEDNWVSSKWILVPMLPVTLSMKVLAPCKFKNTCWTVWTFVVSVALIGGLTYVSVWMVHCFGEAVGLPETVSGMTILSWGTGIPELIASIVLIKKTAQADMAICNTIGSNVIDVSFCLSLPWIVKCILNKSAGLKPEVPIQSAALPWTSFTLLLSVMMLIIIFKLNDWILDFRAGVWLTLTYIAFVIGATYLESSFSSSGLDLFEYI